MPSVFLVHGARLLATVSTMDAIELSTLPAQHLALRAIHQALFTIAILCWPTVAIAIGPKSGFPSQKLQTAAAETLKPKNLVFVVRRCIPIGAILTDQRIADHLLLKRELRQIDPSRSPVTSLQRLKGQAPVTHVRAGSIAYMDSFRDTWYHSCHFGFDRQGEQKYQKLVQGGRLAEICDLCGVRPPKGAPRK